MSRGLDPAFERIAALVLQDLSEMISAMLHFAEMEIESEEFVLGGKRLVLRRSSSPPEVICLLGADDCFALLERAASRAGTSLETFDDLDGLNVSVPEAEFGDNMVTGAFETWRGISVQRCDPMEEILSVLGKRLGRRGIYLECDDSSGEMVIIFSMLSRSKRSRAPERGCNDYDDS